MIAMAADPWSVDELEAQPLSLHPDVAAMALRLQSALEQVTGQHLDDLEALLVASAMAWEE